MNSNQISFKLYQFKDYINTTLNNNNFYKPTPVQEKVIPYAIKNESLMVESATGSGKTLAFMLPILQNLDLDLQEVQSVIVSPTRELATQLYSVLESLIKDFPVKVQTALVVGGSDREQELKKFTKAQPQIVVATLGRLHDLVITSNVLKIHKAKTIVIDEADMIFAREEIEQVDHIMGKIQEQPQFLIFSATISKALRHFLDQYFKDIRKIILEEKTLTTKNIEHKMLQCKAKQKEHVLLDLIKIINPYLAIIFVNKKETVDEVAKLLAENGLNVGKLHGDMDSRARKQMIKRIANLDFKYIVASDIAARGIDIAGVSHVINFDLPNDVEFYIHRTGRTARFNNSGQAYSLYAYEDDTYIKNLQKLGLVPQFVKIVNGEEIPVKMEKKSTHSFVRDIETKVHQSVKMPKKVKPGYKKKRNEEIDKKIRKAKREHIEEIYRKKARRDRKNENR